MLRVLGCRKKDLKRLRFRVLSRTSSVLLMFINGQASLKNPKVFFDQAGALISDNEVSEYLVAAYRQHLGKLYFDRGKFEKAREEFESALTIRTKVSAPKDQIESSRTLWKLQLRSLKRLSSAFFSYAHKEFSLNER